VPKQVALFPRQSEQYNKSRDYETKAMAKEEESDIVVSALATVR